ncbi:hypothetical protein [Streptomyces sp. NPDC005148]
MSGEASPTGGSGVAATAVFVEVLLVGVAFLFSVGLGVASLIDLNKHATEKMVGSTPVIAFGVALSYVLGIVVDRVADKSLDRWSDLLRAEYFQTDKEYSEARLRVSSVPWISEQAMYARSRMRVCRGWIIISPALTASSILWILRRSHEGANAIHVSMAAILGLILTGSIIYSWRSIVVAGYKQLAAQSAAMLRENVEVPPQARSSAVS